MNERAWQKAWQAQSLPQAHDALVALRPAPNAALSVWEAYYLRSASVYRKVAEADPDHAGHARYWADREKAKGDKLTAESAPVDKSQVRSTRRTRGDAHRIDTAAMPKTLERAHEALWNVQPATNADSAMWQAYHLHAAWIYAELAEVDRAHHHEALFWAGRHRDQALAFATEGAAEIEANH